MLVGGKATFGGRQRKRRERWRRKGEGEREEKEKKRQSIISEVEEGRRRNEERGE